MSVSNFYYHLVFHVQSELIAIFSTNMNFLIAKLKKLITFVTVSVVIWSPVVWERATSKP